MYTFLNLDKILPTGGQEWTTIRESHNIKSLLSQTEYSEGLKDIVERCLDPNPKSRIDAVGLAAAVHTRSDSLTRVAPKRPCRFEDGYNSTPVYYATSSSSSSQPISLFESGMHKTR